MVRNAVRALWAEPRPSQPPVRVWRDWALLGVLVPLSVLDGVLGLRVKAWPPVTVTVGVVLALTLLWRRTHPLAAVAVAFGFLIAVDVATIIAAAEPTMPWTTASALLLTYSLFRWGAGREAAIGLVIILAWQPITFTAEPPESAAELAAGYGFFLFSAALGASIRYHASTRIRDIDRAKLREREQLARELHDTVAHHVSAIAVQAQAGRTLAASHPDRAMAALEIIEEAASRTLDEMRTMVGALREGEEPDLVPQPGVTDIARLARRTGDWPRVDVELSGDFDDLAPSVGAAIYRLAQESITNAVRHARHATRISVRVADDDDDCVRLTVRDDGDGSPTGQGSWGYGLVGMTERATLLGGTLEAGPNPDSGWTVNAVLPKAGAGT
jgi:signal transduction histidine kinase